jgi:hypothetical protein
VRRSAAGTSPLYPEDVVVGQRLLSLFVIGFLLYFLLASPGEAGDTIQAAFEVAADLLGRLLASIVTFLSNAFS